MKVNMKKVISIVLILIIVLVGGANNVPKGVQAATNENDLAETYLSTNIKYLSFDSKETVTYDFNIKEGVLKAGTYYSWYIEKDKGNPKAVIIDSNFALE